MILENEFPPDVRVEKEISALTQAGHKIFLVAASFKKVNEYEHLGDLTIYRIYISRLMYKLSALALLFPFYFIFWKRHLKKILSINQFDVIHLHDLPLASVVYGLGMTNDIPVVFDFHENRPEIMKLYTHTNTIPGKLLISQKKWESYQNKFSQLAKRLILVTPEAKDYYIEKYSVNPETTYVVPNYADIDRLNTFSGDNKIINKYIDNFMLVYFGDTGLRRGTLTIIEAARILKEQPEFQFVIIGKSRAQQLLVKKLKEYNLNNVELTGYLDFENIVSYIMASKVGLCPFLRNIHHDTTYANKLFQYMFFGKPVIVSDCPAQVTIINESNAGLVYKANHPDDLANKIRELSDKNLYNILSQNAEQVVRDKYNSNQGNKNLLKLYNSFKGK